MSTALTSPEIALTSLRDALRAGPATGADGFEGLLAACLARMTGVSVRLARSGAQFGRDGSSDPDSPVGIAFEAKRHKDSPSLQEIVGKAAQGAFALSGDVDLWVLGATAPVGDDTVKQASAILEQAGMSLLVLDWSEHELPRLATLVAAYPDLTLGWWERVERPAGVEISAETLASVCAHSDFEVVLSTLRANCASPLFGYGALQEHAEAWLRGRFASRPRSRASFGQFLDTETPTQAAVPRPAALDALRTAMRSAADANLSEESADEAAVVLVEGDEGTGKSWLVACAWSTMPSAPVCLFVSGPRMQALFESGASYAQRALATLLAEQDKSEDPARVSQWERRLARWAHAGPSAEPRFLVVLDGLNEHPHAPWGELLPAFAELARQLGGLCVATSRPSFFAQYVARRLGDTVRLHRVEVGPYVDEELDLVLERAGLAPTEVVGDLRTFLRTPRVAAVAVHLASKLPLVASDLTKERLLWEYWKHREEERGNRLAHTDEDFARVVASHAAAWREAQRESHDDADGSFAGSDVRTPESPPARALVEERSLPLPVRFDADKWAEHSGAARRAGLARVQDDMMEVAEGRFLVPVPDRSGVYTFRPDVLPYALGVLVMREVRDAADRPPRGATHPRSMRALSDELDEAVDAALAPIRGFDLAADILGAAFGLACLEESYPDAGRRALLRAWCGLQNRGWPTREMLRAYVRIAPDTVLHVVEETADHVGGVVTRQPLLELLRVERHHPAVAPLVDDRVQQWLRRWARPAAPRTEAVEAALNAMSPTQQQYLHQNVLEVASEDEAQLAGAAVVLMVGRPLAPFVPALVGWALVQAIGEGASHRWDDLAWLIRLNPRDPAETHDAVWSSVRELLAQAVEARGRYRDLSAPAPAVPVFALAAAALLRLLGDAESSAWADEVAPRSIQLGWSRADDFCETDPYDPSSPRGERLAAAVAAVEALAPETLWAGMAPTEGDITLRFALPALARFEPQVAVGVLRAALRSTREREWGALHGFAAELQWLAPLIDAPTADALRIATRRLASGEVAPEPTPRDTEVIGGMLIGDFASVALCGLPAAEQLALLQDLPSTTPLDHDLLAFAEPLSASALDAELRRTAGTNTQRWTLFFAALPGTQASMVTREILSQHLAGDQADLSALAAFAVSGLADPDLDAELLRLVGAGHPTLRALQEAPAVISGVTAAVLRRPVAAETVEMIHPDVLRSVYDELGTVGRDAVDAIMRRIMREALSPDGDAEPQSVLIVAKRSPEQAYRVWSDFPPANPVMEFAARYPDETTSWLRRMIVEGSALRWLELRAFAAVLAGGIAAKDGALAREVLRHIYHGSSRHRVNIDGVDVVWRAVFSDADALRPLQEDLLRRCQHDADLESALRAAEAAGADGCLDQLVDRWLSGSSRSDVARAITITGLRRSPVDPDGILGHEWSGEFLRGVAGAALDAWKRYVRMRTWLQAAIDATDPLDVWRFGTLAASLADSRLRHSSPMIGPRSEAAHRFGHAIFRRGYAAAKQQTAQRERMLFGWRLASPDMRSALNDDLA